MMPSRSEVPVYSDLNCVADQTVDMLHDLKWEAQHVIHTIGSLDRLFRHLHFETEDTGDRAPFQIELLQAQLDSERAGVTLLIQRVMRVKTVVKPVIEAAATDASQCTRLAEHALTELGCDSANKPLAELAGLITRERADLVTTARAMQKRLRDCEETYQRSLEALFWERQTHQHQPRIPAVAKPLEPCNETLVMPSGQLLFVRAPQMRAILRDELDDLESVYHKVAGAYDLLADIKESHLVQEAIDRGEQLIHMEQVFFPEFEGLASDLPEQRLRRIDLVRQALIDAWNDYEATYPDV